MAAEVRAAVRLVSVRITEVPDRAPQVMIVVEDFGGALVEFSLDDTPWDFVDFCQRQLGITEATEYCEVCGTHKALRKLDGNNPGYAYVCCCDGR